MRKETFMCITCAKETDHSVITLDGDIPMWACVYCVAKGMYGVIT